MNKRNSFIIVGALLIIIGILLAVMLITKTPDTVNETERQTTVAVILESEEEVEESTEVETTLAEYETSPAAILETDESGDAVEMSTDDGNTGDVYWVVGDRERFLNNEEFLASVPTEIAEVIYKNVPNDLLDVYTDIKYVGYDELSMTVYAEDSVNYHAFQVKGKAVDTTMIIKEYCDWWPYVSEETYPVGE